MRTRHCFAATVLGLMTLSLSAAAQEAAKVPIVGVLLRMALSDDPVVPAIREGLRRFGYVDGTNIRIERRSLDAARICRALEHRLATMNLRNAIDILLPVSPTAFERIV